MGSIMDAFDLDLSVSDEGGDMIVWEKESIQNLCPSNRVIDETDNYDPVAENDENVLSLTERELKGPNPKNLDRASDNNERSGKAAGEEHAEKNDAIPFEPVCD